MTTPPLNEHYISAFELSITGLWLQRYKDKIFLLLHIVLKGHLYIRNNMFHPITTLSSFQADQKGHWTQLWAILNLEQRQTQICCFHLLLYSLYPHNQRNQGCSGVKPVIMIMEHAYLHLSKITKAQLIFIQTHWNI